MLRLLVELREKLRSTYIVGISWRACMQNNVRTRGSGSEERAAAGWWSSLTSTSPFPYTRMW